MFVQVTPQESDGIHMYLSFLSVMNKYTIKIMLHNKWYNYPFQAFPSHHNS